MPEQLTATEIQHDPYAWRGGEPTAEAAVAKAEAENRDRDAIIRHNQQIQRENIQKAKQWRQQVQRNGDEIRRDRGPYGYTQAYSACGNPGQQAIIEQMGVETFTEVSDQSGHAQSTGEEEAESVYNMLVEACPYPDAVDGVLRSSATDMAEFNAPAVPIPEMKKLQPVPPPSIAIVAPWSGVGSGGGGHSSGGGGGHSYGKAHWTRSAFNARVHANASRAKNRRKAAARRKK